MINPALDYLTRNPEILDIDIPCSFMAEGMGGIKKVVAIHALPAVTEMVHVKTWHLDQLKEGDILPSSTGTNMAASLLKTPWMVFPEGVRPIGYLAEFPTVSSNRRDRPIPQETYDDICGNMWFSISHRQNREQFLWEACEGHFFKDYKAHQYIRAYNAKSLQDYANQVDPRKARYWAMWRVHMLDFPCTIAPELFYWANSVAFSSSFDGPMVVGSFQ